MTYSVINRGLRPSRVLIVFDGGDDWSYWARRALYLANQVWGGAGFGLVPQKNGVVDPVLLRACRAFDPDYVVTFPSTIAEPDRTGARGTPGSDDEHLAGQGGVGRQARTADFHGDPRPGDWEARDLVASVCSPYRHGDKELSSEWVEFLELASEEFPAADAVPGAYPAHVLQCPPTWGGLAGAAVAAHAGVAELPDPAAVEPELDGATISRLTHWFFDQPQPSLPRDLLWFPNNVSTGVLTEDTPLAHERTMAGLVPVSSSQRDAGLVLAVFGDTAEDFALAQLSRLTYGRCVWLPSFLGTDKESVPYALSSGLSDMARSTRGRRHALTLTSLSRPVEELTRIHERLRTGPYATAFGNEGARPDVRSAHAAQLDWTRTNTQHLAIVEQYADVLTVPTVTDETGTREMVAPPPPPAVQDLALASHPDLRWHVDIAWTPSKSVRGRGVPGHELFAPTTGPWLTVARNSRDGISHLSSRLDFVATGTQNINRIARPALRELSLHAFIAAKATEHGMTIRVSDAGQRTAQLTRMLGGRDKFTALFGGRMLPVLHDLCPSSTTNDKAYPDGDGVALRVGEGVLSFDGICARATGMDRSDIHDQVDAALRAGVLRRGLVLRCQVCLTKQLQTIDKVGQRWNCDRCDATNDLDHGTWHISTDEPTWFYGLHPVGEHLLRDHGDVPALLAAHLSQPAPARPSTYQDVTEIEFVTDGKPTVEADLIAYRGDTLIVAECKSSGALGSTSNTAMRAEIVKKCRAAAWLQADQLVFATTAAAWKPGVENAVRGNASSFDQWPAFNLPAILLITGLGGPNPVTTTLTARVPGRQYSEETASSQAGTGHDNPTTTGVKPTPSETEAG